MALQHYKQTSLQPTQFTGWRSGLANLWHKESQHWWQSWYWQLLIWVILLDGFMAIAAVATQFPVSAGSPPSPGINELVLLCFTLFPSFGTLIMAHGKLLDELQSGTASWVLSKPVTRSAFMLSKFASIPGMLLTMVVMPGAIAYPLVWLITGKMLSPLTFMLILMLEASYITFFFCLMLLFGALMKKRSAILGLGLFICFVLFQVIFQNSFIANSLVDQALLLLFVVAALLVGALLFFLLALARFVREEF